MLAISAVTFLCAHSRALAQFSETNVSLLAEFDARCDQDAVDVDARMALKLEEHIHQAGISRSPAQHPTPAAQDRPCERLNEPPRFVCRDGSHLQGPGDRSRLHGI